MYHFFVNYKLEPAASLRNSVIMTRNLFDTAQELAGDVQMVFVPGILDLQRVLDESSEAITVFAPHVDPILPGPGTGFVAPLYVKQIGCEGTVLNHAEHKLDLKILEKTIQIVKEQRLSVMVCANSLEETEKILPLQPDFIAYEPPALIGGNISVSTAEPQVVQQFVKMVGDVAVPIIGAGIKTVGDVTLSVELGARGVFVASGIIKASDPSKAFAELLSGFSPRD